MVCSKCEKKLAKIVCPDVWKDGARNVVGGKDGGRKVGKVRTKTTLKQARFNPLARPCRICKTKVSQTRAHYCNDCAFKKRICAMCGRKQGKTSSSASASSAARLKKKVKSSSSSRSSKK